MALTAHEIADLAQRCKRAKTHPSYRIASAEYLARELGYEGEDPPPKIALFSPDHLLYLIANYEERPTPIRAVQRGPKPKKGPPTKEQVPPTPKMEPSVAKEVKTPPKQERKSVPAPKAPEPIKVEEPKVAELKTLDAVEDVAPAVQVEASKELSAEEDILASIDFP